DGDPGRLRPLPGLAGQAAPARLPVGSADAAGRRRPAETRRPARAGLPGGGRGRRRHRRRRVRMQLSRLAPLLLLVVAVPARTDAGVEAASHLTLFREPSSHGGSVQVVHPQTDVSATLGATASITAGYEVDIVSGATPAVYGAAQPDAVSGA